MRRFTFPAVCALLLAAAGPVSGQAGAAERAAALHLLQRATFGARPGDLDAVLSMGVDGWLERQLHPARIPDPDLDRRLAPFARLGGSMTDLHAAFPPPDLLAREIGERYGIDRARLGRPGGRAALPREALRELRERGPRRLLEDLASARLVRAVHAERQLEEVMTDFWFNHFNIHAGKQLTRWMVADYEREAIRAHVFGRFEDMLLATARHPAMLFYLDNWRSVARDSRRGRGLNENYARELLELHTLGVNGGYSEADVLAVARTLTGWSFVPFRAALRPGLEPATFVFNGRGHDRGAKTVLGRTFPAGGGQDEGEAVLRMLARSPQTARFLSAKLVERFVTDDPDPAFIDELSAVWMRTGGDLREVTRALFTSARFDDAAVHGTKVRTPFELVAAALRATGADAGPSRGILETLRAMGHLPYDAAAPTGYPAASDDWVNSGAMLARMNFGLALAAGRIDGVRPVRDPAMDVETMLLRILPGADTDRLARLIREDLARDPAADPHARALGLALGSPEFQRR